MEVILSAWRKSGCWPFNLDYARGFNQTPYKPTSYVADTPGRVKQMVAETNSEPPPPIAGGGCEELDEVEVMVRRYPMLAES